MQGVITLLDPDHTALTEALWAELAADLNLHGVRATPFPHFSYHVAAGYDRGRLVAALRRAAAGAVPFDVTTTGLGVFTGSAPVLYIPVVKTAALAAFQDALWPAVEAAATGSQPYYAPAHWMPHITLGQGDITPEKLGDALRRLGTRSYNWVIRVDHLAYVDEVDEQQHVARRLDFGAT